MIRLHVHDPLMEGSIVSPPADQARYLLGVMRLRVGESLLLFNGRDGEWLARLQDASKKECRLRVERLTRIQAAPPEVDLIAALVKRGPLETMVEKAVELGARRIRLILTRRTNADRANLGRLQAIAREAAEQTGRLEAPEILAPQPLPVVLAAWPQEGRLLFCDEAGDDPDAPWGGPEGRAAPAAEALFRQRSLAGRPWGVLIGPEGGFAPEERALLRSSALVTPVSLGPRILRADTAAVAALCLWQAVLGDWSPREAPTSDPAGS
jgi:16S rRNA (uracil1498-N3)-methyltransferase